LKVLTCTIQLGRNWAQPLPQLFYCTPLRVPDHGLPFEREDSTSAPSEWGTPKFLTGFFCGYMPNWKAAGARGLNY